MAASLRCSLRVEMIAAIPAGTDTRKSFSLPMDLAAAANTDSIAEVRIVVDDYDGVTPADKPAVEVQLDGDPIVINITYSAGTEAVVTEKVNGDTDDFTVIRAIAVKLVATNTGSAATGKVAVSLGDDAEWDHAVIPVRLDSTGPEVSGAVIALPAGMDYATGHPLLVTVHEASNLTVLVQVLGK